MMRWRGISVVLLTFSGVYLYALPSATIPYGAIVLLHATLGIILAAQLLPWFVRLFPAESLLTRVGWFFMALFVAGPAFWLFHPWFVLRVILPFMQAIHAL